MTRHICALAFACAIVGAAPIASAQTAATTGTEDPAATARFRLGALRFTPALAISNVGVDSNVFNTATDPKQDTTAAVGPQVNLWLRAGKARFSGTAGAQYLYFKTYDNQRSWNTSDQLRLDLPFVRVQPFVGGSYVNNRDRPGFEIDSRIRQKLMSWQAGSSIRLGSRTSLVLSGAQAYTKFDDTAIGDVIVSRALNRRTDVESLQFRNNLTPLTTFFAGAETVQDRFDEEPVRNADSVKGSIGFSLKPAALISGEVSIGFRHFNLLRLDVPTYNGPVASASVQSRLGSTLVAFSENRDIAFSYGGSHPVYVQTSTGVSVTRKLNRSWDIVGRGVYTLLLNYRTLESLATTGPEPRDTIAQYGGSIGYLVGRTFRVSLDVDHAGRTTQDPLNSNYSGFRAGMSIKYGLSQ